MAAVSRPLTAPVVDAYTGGPHATAIGTTTLLTIDGTPVRRRVRLHDQPTGRIVREMWSDAVTGQWRFENIRAGRFYVVAFDHTGLYNGVVVSDLNLP
jgi:hypothetical protein